MLMNRLSGEFTSPFVNKTSKIVISILHDETTFDNCDPFAGLVYDVTEMKSLLD